MTELFVSPSRRYVIVYKKKYSNQEHLFELKNLSELYVNDVSGATAYFKANVLHAQETFISCVPYEAHLEHIQAQDKLNSEISRHFLSPYHPTSEAKSMSSWNCIKLVRRYGYREKRPEHFLFSLPRIVVKSLEEELIKQANLEYLANHPLCNKGPYYKDNHYSMVFTVEGSGWEEIMTYWDSKIHRQITIYFTDLVAIFGTGLEDA